MVCGVPLRMGLEVGKRLASIPQMVRKVEAAVLADEESLVQLREAESQQSEFYLVLVSLFKLDDRKMGCACASCPSRPPDCVVPPSIRNTGVPVLRAYGCRHVRYAYGFSNVASSLSSAC